MFTSWTSQRLYSKLFLSLDVYWRLPSRCCLVLSSGPPPFWRSFFLLQGIQSVYSKPRRQGFRYEAAGEEAGRKLHKNVESSIKQVLATTPHETPTIRTLAPHHKNYTSSTNQTRRTLLEKQGRAHKRCTPVDPHSWLCKSGTTSTNLHTAAMWGHGL